MLEQKKTFKNLVTSAKRSNSIGEPSAKKIASTSKIDTSSAPDVQVTQMETEP